LGAEPGLCWWLEGEAPGLVNCTAEGAEIAQVVVIGNDTQIVGGKYFGARAELEAAAFQIGELGLPAPAGTFINSKVVNCLGALNFVRDQTSAGTRSPSGRPRAMPSATVTA